MTARMSMVPDSRSEITTLATGVSPWTMLTREISPVRDGTIVPSLTGLDRPPIEFHGLTPVATIVSPLRG